MRVPRSKIDRNGQRLPVGVFWRGDVYEFIYRDVTGRQRQETTNNIETAVALRTERMLAARRDRVLLAPQRRRWRTAAWRASIAAATLRQEQRLAKMEAEVDAARLERQRLARAIRQLPPDDKAAGRALTALFKAAQELDRASAEGMKAVRLRATQALLYDVEDSLKRVLFAD